MNGRVLRRWIAGCWLLGSGVLAAGNPPAVEVINRLQISGNQVYSTEKILKQLRSHPRALEAANRSTPEWHAAAQSLLLSGYHSLGFADATVTLTGQGQLLISEGLRYKSGDIRITGASDSLALSIRTQLSGPPTARALGPDVQSRTLRCWASSWASDEPPVRVWRASNGTRSSQSVRELHLAASE